MQPAVLAFEALFNLAPAGSDGQTSFDLAASGRAAKTSFDLAAARRKTTLWRLDGGFGADAKLLWVLGRQYQISAKGFSGRRAANLAKQVTRWTPYGDAWLGAVACPVDCGREVQAWVKRYLEHDQYHYSYYLSTLKLHSLHAQMAAYDHRGAAEIEQFRQDKQGLGLATRRKHGCLAQKALILLDDIAHNLLADFSAQALAHSPFCGYAAKRIVRDLLAIEGRLVWDGPRLARIELCRTHPNAEALVPCLRTYLAGVKTPG